MAVVNGETGDWDRRRDIDAERAPQQASDEAEQRIPGESEVAGVKRPPEIGHARMDLPFPTSAWYNNVVLLHQKQQHHQLISSTSITPTPPSPPHLQMQPAQQLKRHSNYSISNSSSSSSSSGRSIGGSTRRSRTTSTLPSTATRHQRYQSSSPHPLAQHTNGTSTTSVTTTIPTPPIVVPKKTILGHSCRVSKRYRYSRMRRVKRQEYKKLRQMVPALQEKNKVSKVVVIEEAIKYIDELHSALVQRFKSRDIPTTFNGVHLDPKEVHGGNIRELIRRLLANANPNSLPPARIENVRTLPSFLQKLGRHKKS